jgi:metal-responsive CopG/Arc/MetJ family transcriptional regulator
MKEKTSITLSTDVLAGIDQLAGSKHSRSSFIERVLRSYLSQRAREQLQARDLDRLNQAAQRLNAEAAEVIEYQGMDAPADRSAEE